MDLIFLLLNGVSLLIDLTLSPFLQSSNEKSLQNLLFVPNEVHGKFEGASKQNWVLSEATVTLDGRPRGRRGNTTRETVVFLSCTEISPGLKDEQVDTSAYHVMSVYHVKKMNYSTKQNPLNRALQCVFRCCQRQGIWRLTWWAGHPSPHYPLTQSSSTFIHLVEFLHKYFFE